MSGGMDVIIDSQLVREVAGVFQNSSNELDDTISAAISIANQLDDGVLQGRAGDAMSAALRHNLQNSVRRLQEKLNEIANDLYRAADIHDEAEQQSRSQY